MRAPIGAIVLLLLSCSAAPQRPHPTSDDGWGPTLHEGQAPPHRPPAEPASRPEALAADERRPWKRSGEATRRVGGRDRSDHLGGRYERTVRINDEAAPYERLTASTPFPAGALVVQHHHRPDEEAIAVSYVMEKRGPEPTAWRFSVVDARGRLAARENLKLCVRCHREAPHGLLFGPPPAPTP